MDRAAFDLGENEGCTIKKNRLVERYRRCIYCKRGISEESLIYYSFLSHYGEFRDTCARTITRKYVHTKGARFNGIRRCSTPGSEAFVISCRCLFIGYKRFEVSLVKGNKPYQCCVKIQRFHGVSRRRMNVILFYWYYVFK